MKIGLFGYGKMGKAIEAVALQRGHEIVCRINSENRSSVQPDDLKVADVVIEFTVPDAAIRNFQLCLDAGVPIVTGTTGWVNRLEEVKKLVETRKGSFVYGSNFSLGVNILFYLNRKLSAILSKYPEYKAHIEEIHHTAKLDSPSGTAISLANQMLNQHAGYATWKEMKTLPEDASDILPILAFRENNVPGTHLVSFNSPVDTIEIKHTAHNRNGFALGAVLAAEWIREKKGFFEVSAMFNFDEAEAQ